MKTAIIGANSYIARNMIQVNAYEQFIEQVTLFDRADEHIDHAENYYSIDVMNLSELEAVVGDYDLIYFFVGKTGTTAGFEESTLYLDINEKSVLCLLNACKNVGFKGKIVFPSTRLVYKGDSKLLKEEAEKEFLTPYAMQKYACENYLAMFQNMYGIDYCVVRICVPYGTLVYPVTSYGTADFFVKQVKEQGKITVFGDGSQRRTATYIGDLCNIMWLTGLNAKCVNDIYNIGGQDVSIREIADSVALIYGGEVAEIPWPASDKILESGHTVFDATKLEELLEYTPRMTIQLWLEGKV